MLPALYYQGEGNPIQQLQNPMSSLNYELPRFVANIPPQAITNPLSKGQYLQQFSHQD